MVYPCCRCCDFGTFVIRTVGARTCLPKGHSTSDCQLVPALVPGSLRILGREGMILSAWKVLQSHVAGTGVFSFLAAWHRRNLAPKTSLSDAHRHLPNVHSDPTITTQPLLSNAVGLGDDKPLASYGTRHACSNTQQVNPASTLPWPCLFRLPFRSSAIRLKVAANV